MRVSTVRAGGYRDFIAILYRLVILARQCNRVPMAGTGGIDRLVSRWWALDIGTTDGNLVAVARIDGRCDRDVPTGGGLLGTRQARQGSEHEQACHPDYGHSD